MFPSQRSFCFPANLVLTSAGAIPVHSPPTQGATEISEHDLPLKEPLLLSPLNIPLPLKCSVFVPLFCFVHAEVPVVHVLLTTEVNSVATSVALTLFTGFNAAAVKCQANKGRGTCDR